MNQKRKIAIEILREELSDLFLFTFFNDLTRIKKVKSENSNLFDRSHLYPLNDGKTFDLYNLTVFNDIIWKAEGWKTDFIPFVRERRKETKEVLDFWHCETHPIRNHSKFDYSEYWEYFYCEDPGMRDYTNLKPNDSFLQKGIKEIDLMLYNRAECFDFKEVRNLLKRGANPNTDLYEEDEEEDTIISRIEIESGYLNTLIVPLFISFEEEKYNQNFNLEEMFSDLLGLAAHEEMYKLLTTTKPDKWMMENL